MDNKYNIKKLNKHTGIDVPHLLRAGFSEIRDLRTSYIRSDNRNVQYGDLNCPKIGRCYGINQVWICLQSDMICDGNPQCYGELDELYCCYSSSFNCSSIQEMHLQCTRSAEVSRSDQDSLDFIDWKSSPFFDIFGFTILLFRCFIQMKYSDVNLVERKVNNLEIYKYHILRQIGGQTIFRNLENLHSLSMSGQIPNITKQTFKSFHKLNKLVLSSTNLGHIGKSFSIQHENEPNRNDSENIYMSIIYKDGFQGLNNLRHLIISKNPFLSTIDNNAFNGLENLRYLTISKNQLLSIIDNNAFNGLENLRYLTISKNQLLSIIDNNAFNGLENLRYLSITKSQLLSTIENNAFNGLENLRYVAISGNQVLSTIESNTFDGLKNLCSLEIRENRNLTTIKSYAFSGLTLCNLFISENSELLNEYVFAGLTSVGNLTLSRRVLNKVTFTENIPSLRKGDFYTDTIHELLLLKTNITHLTGYFFGGIENLKILLIVENQFLSNLHNYAFSNLTFLVQLTISKNPQLTTIEKDAFTGPESLTNLKMLNISCNKLEILKENLFDNLTNLEVIDLRKNNLHLTSNVFKKNENLKRIYADSYAFCCVKPWTVKDEHCFAPIDDISSCKELIADRQLSGFLWEIGIIAFFGNILVLLFRFIKDRGSLKHTFSVFVINLSCSDAMMGLYMLTIAYHDSIYEGEYVWNDYSWKQSFVCKMAGTLSFITSESSVIFIGLITIDRFLAVKYPIGGKRFTLRHAYMLSFLAWVIAAVLGIVPVLIYPQFYSYSGTCLALPLTGHFNPGWQISIAVFLGFNCVLFVLITIGQICILRNIIQSARRTRSKHSSKEREVAIFLFLVALTDAMCWFPVGIIVIMALAGMPISSGIYAWIIIFVLPVNSAVNPFLYTFAPLCRKKQKELRTAKAKEQDPVAVWLIQSCRTENKMRLLKRNTV